MSYLLYSSLPKKPGVYLFKDALQKILYVGKAKNLKARVSSYFQNQKKLGPKTASLVSQITKISHIRVQSEFEALILESELIKKHQPKYNIELKDGKAYPYLKITIKDRFPRLLTARKITNDQALYFGPYPDAQSVKFLLKKLRTIFPFCTCRHPLKSCLYLHLGLCPGPGIKVSQTDYQKNIRRLISLLKGKNKELIKKLHQEMNLFAQNNEFEKAQINRDLILKIKLLTAPSIASSEYLKNPNLLEDLRFNELNKLKEELNLEKIPVRIECYDISNLNGQEATGSLVVLLNGEIDSSLYRRFKIKILNSPNDYAMLAQVLERRFHHPEWPFPDLILIDGGKGQIGTAKVVLEKLNLKINLASLAKKEEVIYYYDHQDFLKELILKKENPALKILQRIRDESHRFAKNYHLKLRSKKFLPNKT